MKIGIIGAGYVARAITTNAVKHGHQVMLSNELGPKSLYTATAMLKCEAGTIEEAVAFGDVVILSIPFDATFDFDPALLAGKTVIDTGNYHPKRDGEFKPLTERKTTSTQMVADHFADATVVKGFNAILAPDLEELARTGPSEPRRAVPYAADDEKAGAILATLYEEFGLEAYNAGSLADSWRFERNKPAYCSRNTREKLVERLAAADRNVELEDGYWDE